jgi:hypothetical protein
LFSEFNRMNGLVEFSAGRSSFSNSRKHRGPSLELFFSAVLKRSGTVNAKVMQDKSFAATSSATYSCSGPEPLRGLNTGVIPSGIACCAGVGLIRSTLV